MQSEGGGGKPTTKKMACTCNTGTFVSLGSSTCITPIRGLVFISIWGLNLTKIVVKQILVIIGKWYNWRRTYDVSVVYNGWK